MRRLALAILAAALFTGCDKLQDKIQTTPQKSSLFIGIDVSGSFYNTRYFDQSIDFLSYYIYGRLNHAGDLKGLKTLFVGSIGGDKLEETKSFHPIEDFQGKSADQIRADLHRWFRKSDRITDFNVFFQQVAIIAQKRNLSLSPITVVLVSDGVPDIPGEHGDAFSRIDVGPLEYLSRNTTIRLLYATPVMAHKWEMYVPRKRARLWTADNQVMEGWKAQMKPDVPLMKQDKFWAWISANVDYRVQPVHFQFTKKKKSV